MNPGMTTQVLAWCCASLALAAAFCAWIGADPAAAAGRRCGEVARVGESGAELVSVRARGVRCDTARWVFEHPRAAAAKGWHCHSAGSEASCTAAAGAMVRYGPTRRDRRCGHVVFAPQSEDATGEIIAARVSCRKSRSVARGSRDFGPTHRFSYRARGFACESGPAPPGALPSRLVTCRRGAAIIAFERF